MYHTHLKYSEETLPEAVEVGARFILRGVEVKTPAEHLHAQQGEDDDEKEEQQQQGGDRLDRVQQRGDQIRQRMPIPVCDKLIIILIRNIGGAGWIYLLCHFEDAQ